MITIVLVTAAALILAGLSYGRGGLTGPVARFGVALRAVAWTALGLLLLNPGCPVSGLESRPLVLLDGSLSMTAAGGRWREARDSAGRWGEVRLFGDPERLLDTAPVAGGSRLTEALASAAALGRPVVVVTDGELESTAAMARDAQVATVRLFPRAELPAAAIERVDAPRRTTPRDTLVLRVTIRSRRLPPGPVTVTVSTETRELVRGTASLGPAGGAELRLAVLPGRLPAGQHLLTVGFADSLDAEPRDDRQLVSVVVSPLPGVVLLAAPGDWDASFLYRILRDVTDLPVEGFMEVERGTWRRMSDLRPVASSEIRRAAAGADLLVLRGAPSLAAGGGARARLEWPSSSLSSDAALRDWYLAIGPTGPIANALAGLPLDSFPPAAALIPVAVDSGDWIGLTAQAGRRGQVRPALVGSIRPGGARRVVIGVDGLWRWGFRAGSSEQAYRALVATTVDWLLAVPDTAQGSAGPVRPVVAQGTPVVFRWRRMGAANTLGIRLRSGEGTERLDSLRFDPEGRARLWLAPGVYAYQLDRGGEGRIVVDAWSSEWFPRSVTIAAREATPAGAQRTQGLRERWWLFALGVAALCGEWFLRRRLGLR